MSAVDTIQVGDIGTIIRLTIEDCGTAVDVSSASTMSIILQSPTQGDASVTKTATHFTDGTDGIIQYTLIADDIDTAGIWRVQGKVVMPSGTWSSSVHEIRVLENL